LKEYGVEACGVGVVLDINLVVDDGDGFVIVENSVVHLTNNPFFSKGDEALPP
jgi:hypothetical protein